MNLETKCLLTEISKFTPTALLPSLLKVITNGSDSSKSYLTNLDDQGKIDYIQLEYDVSFLSKCDFEKAMKYLYLIRHSKSQLRQDIHALLHHNFKRNGYFVEIGATDGITFSNTYMLEKLHGWEGIVVEPSPQYTDKVFSNRNCHVETKCVYKTSGNVVKFIEHKNTSLSGIEVYNNLNRLELDNNNSEVFQIPTISLNDLLSSYDAPKVIDYLSIDTEGSELSILENFNFDDYEVGFFTIEHNFTPIREDILKLMKKQGYRRVLENYSQWDDYYIPATSQYIY